MRNRVFLAGLLVLSLAECASGASSPAPSTATSPPVAASPSIVASTPKTAPLGVEVRWDGSQCTYLGPTVILDGTLTRFTFTSGDTVPLELIVVGVEPGTTFDQIVADIETHPGQADQPPAYAILMGLANIPPNSSALFTISSKIWGITPVGGYFVGCATGPKPEGTDMMYPAALLQVAGG